MGIIFPVPFPPKAANLYETQAFPLGFWVCIDFHEIPWKLIKSNDIFLRKWIQSRNEMDPYAGQTCSISLSKWNNVTLIPMNSNTLQRIPIDPIEFH